MPVHFVTSIITHRRGVARREWRDKFSRCPARDLLSKNITPGFVNGPWVRTALSLSLTARKFYDARFERALTYRDFTTCAEVSNRPMCIGVAAVSSVSEKTRGEAV